MIPFLDSLAQYRSIAAELETAMLGALRSADYLNGESVVEFEQDFAFFCSSAESVAVNSGTSALHLALLAIGIGPGDEVVTVPMAFVGAVAAIIYAGATPVFVDIDPDTWTMDADALERALTPRTKAILPVHLHGRLANMERIAAIAQREGLRVIEDAADAPGAMRDGRGAGTFGDIGCFSFHPDKNLGACGEGGAIITESAELAAAVRSLRDFGRAGEGNYLRHGFNYRMDSLQAAALRAKLQHLADWTDARRRIASLYGSLLNGFGIAAPAPAWLDHSYNVYAVRVRNRDLVRADLAREGIATDVHYARPVHRQPAYAGLGYGPGSFKVSERLAAEMLSLPIYPELSVEDATRVATTLRAICAARDAGVS